MLMSPSLGRHYLISQLGKLRFGKECALPRVTKPGRSVQLGFEPTPQFFPLLPIFSMSDQLVLSTALLSSFLPSLPMQTADHTTNKKN